MTLVLDIPVEKRVELLATLKLQQAELLARGCITSKIPDMSCRMTASAPSYYFCNNLFAATQAFASTRVVVKQQQNIVKTSVHVKRDSRGELMQTIILSGPTYKLQSTIPATDALTTHACTSLFNVYSVIVHSLRGLPAPVRAVVPSLPAEVAEVKFDHDAAVASFLPLFQALPVLPLVTTPPPPFPVVMSLPAPVDVTSSLPPTPCAASPERATKRQRTGASSPTCYICFKPKTCDILFPCRVASHACCRKCIKRLYEMWSSDEYEGTATIKCPQCNNKDGLIQRTDGKVIWLGHRYLLRKKRRLSYAPVEDSF